MSTIITAPETLPAKLKGASVFLAGSIDDGAAQRWQAQFLAAFEKDDLTFLNPRRDQWQASMEKLAHVAAFREQVEWELNALERADIVAMYFAPDSSAPIALMEFGLYARSGKLIVACPEGFWRKGNVDLVCARYQVPVVGDLTELIRAVRLRIAQPKLPAQNLHAGRFLRLIKEAHWEYTDRVNAAGAAIIVAVTGERKVILVEQYRIPVHARTIELPAGLIGDEPGGNDESHAEAARRELLEETGYAAGTMELLTSGPPASGTTSEQVSLFLASNLKRVGAGGGVAHEDITVHEVPLAEIDAWLMAKSKAGVLIDPKIYAGLYFVAQSR